MKWQLELYRGSIGIIANALVSGFLYKYGVGYLK